MSRSIEAELKPRLSGFFGGTVRAYLPQTWEFRTEEGTHSLVVDREGRASVQRGAAADPDVTVEISHDGLRAALTTRSKQAVGPGKVKVTPHTPKGKTAFDLLRSRLGL